MPQAAHAKEVGAFSTAGCHGSSRTKSSTPDGTIAIVGQPNVGKSTLFERLTGHRVIVSNYPGTTVELSHAAGRALPGLVVDTPGLVTFPSRTEDEGVTTRLLIDSPPRVIVQVGDAKNLRRTLLLTVQLAEMGIPTVLALNMADEAEARGVLVDHRLLAEHAGVPVVATTATKNRGLPQLASAIKLSRPPRFRLTYPAEIEGAVASICSRLPETPVAPRALALLWLSGEPVAEEWVRDHLDARGRSELFARREALQLSFPQPLSTVIQHARLAWVESVTRAVTVDREQQQQQGLGFAFGRLATHAVWGLPILAAVLFAIYWFVGVFGAGTLVGLLEDDLFGQRINPWLAEWADRLLPVSLLTDLLVGEYGLWTMGMTYALALILPIVTTFFLAFGVLEDSGYLPRLSVLINRLFRTMGLNGKAVVPMVLGLGCVTMATLTTRILESKRDRLLVIMLLALAIPCSAQLGVVMGMLAGVSLAATVIWASVILGVLLAVGWLAAQLVPGERSTLLIELPPLRRPAVSTVLVKTAARLEWYLKEVVPLFLLGAAAMFVLAETGALSSLIRTTEPLVVGWLGLPAATAAAFVMGFLRRDFGAAGLFVLASQGLLSPAQILVAMVTITLFIPCIASVFMIARERGARTAVAITVLAFPLAFFVGGILHRGLQFSGWGA